MLPPLRDRVAQENHGGVADAFRFVREPDLRLVPEVHRWGSSQLRARQLFQTLRAVVVPQREQHEQPCENHRDCGGATRVPWGLETGEGVLPIARVFACGRE
jgi:hypothetical protein